MEYGYFDNEKREYVITRPDTPAPWANYLGSPAYGAIISNNAGGYSFVESGAAGRILRYRFNEQDKPGRYIYIRDDADGDFWSASWQPVGKPLDKYASRCRHGMGYTAIEAEYRDIGSSVTYYVPVGESHEVWSLTVKNTGDTARNLSVFGYAEFTNDGNYEQDQINLQYTQFITRTYFHDCILMQTINENCQNAVNGNAKASRFLGLAGADVASFCGDRERFLCGDAGPYRSYEKPAAVEAGDCGNALNYGGNTCGALHTRIRLEPGESAALIFLLGQKEKDEALALVKSYGTERTAKELARLSELWRGRVEGLSVKTPDESFNAMVNTWNAYQCFITFHWSRAASLIYCGLRNGFGYRDTVQDIQGIIHLAPELAQEKLVFMLSAQVDHGGALPLVKYTHSAGHENSPEEPSYAQETGHPSYRADDALWLFPTVYKYISETGDTAFLDEKIPYATKGIGTVYEHLMAAIDFSLTNSGIHGLPAGLHADWNDCLRLGAKGVSAFVALQLYYAFDIMARFARLRGDEKDAANLTERKDKFGQLIERHLWAGDRFARGISESGETVGTAAQPEANMWLNPQTWAVISGYERGERAEAILRLVSEKLSTPYGAALMSPAYREHPFEGALALLFNPGMKENAGVFLQAQGWLILAEALLGHGDRAFEYYAASCPAAQNSIADLRKMEPYAYSQFAEGPESPNAGRCHVHWLTGTASTCMVGCVEGILGLRPDPSGLLIAPSIPGAWKELTIEKRFRGKLLRIKIENPDGKQSGMSQITLNGERLDRPYISENCLKNENDIYLLM
ncbi:MAG: N,N'-diacetylchitobiose phosphorylase [Defluviitaleaceae bacterium]|nr:N,N'-diacetylchitobiose phosphorylase [Defluviitaleaceae bacterium]MCL2835405.1 N,N'-diacetylchitobiose phosphorylase [Defluviitaleaceae bacterium]